MEPQHPIAVRDGVHGALGLRPALGGKLRGPLRRPRRARRRGARFRPRSGRNGIDREPLAGALALRRGVRPRQRRHVDHPHRCVAQPLVPAAHGHGQQHRDLRHGGGTVPDHLGTGRPARAPRLAWLLSRTRGRHPGVCPAPRVDCPAWRATLRHSRAPRYDRGGR